MIWMWSPLFEKIHLQDKRYDFYGTACGKNYNHSKHIYFIAEPDKDILCCEECKLISIMRELTK